MKEMMIKYKMISPVSHIGETASTGSYFQTILTASGSIPVITGNSVRGQLRDCMAMHYLDTLDTKVGKDVFNILFSGGNINGTMKDDVEKAKKVREHFPAISLLGGGLGDMIMQGKLLVSFAYPVCKETVDITGVESDKSWHNLMGEMEFTRMDDGKNDIRAKYLLDADEEKTAKASTQMRFGVQYMAAGTEFVQKFIFLDGVTDLELGAFFAGFNKWLEVPRLGGMSAKGFGLFSADTVCNFTVSEINRLVEEYENFIKAQGTDVLSILETKKVKKNGKTSNKTD